MGQPNQGDSSIMETGILTPKALFHKDIRYTIPEFQRRYVWTQEDQWEPLWEDVRNTAEDYLEKLVAANGSAIDAEKNTVQHFLGAVVVQQVSTATKDIERREVIDGQQRLTTLQLLIDAVQYVCEIRNIKAVAKRLDKLVLNDQDLLRNENDAFKLWPTKNDREAFKHAMDNGLAAEEFENSLIVQAHEFFQSQTKQWIGTEEEEIESRMEALETALTGMLRMVVIDLGSQDDPHLIFETLNARGTPLLASELIKNYVVHQASVSGQQFVWGDLDDNWWREDFRQGRLIRPRIDALLDYWLEMYTADEVSAGKVFDVFRTVAEKQHIADIMTKVKSDLMNYRRYEKGPRKPKEEKFYYRAETMQMGAFTPVLLTLLSRPNEERFGALSALESFLVRRMACRNTTKDYNRLSLDLVRELRRKNSDQFDKVVVDFLGTQEADSRRWPRDADLEYSLTTLPLYRLLTRGRLRLLLEGIEEYLLYDSFGEKNEVPKYLTIEHILPQSWEAHWPLPENDDEENARNRRNQLVHSIGNLTLVTGRLNSVASNAPWKDKQESLEEHSVLLLNRKLLADYKDEAWNEDVILARSGKMAAMIADVWPGPDSHTWDR